MSSRVAQDRYGRRIVIGSDGRRWLAIGNCFEAGEPGIRWLGEPDGQRMNAATVKRRSDRDWVPREAA